MPAVTYGQGLRYGQGITYGGTTPTGGGGQGPGEGGGGGPSTPVGEFVVAGYVAPVTGDFEWIDATFLAGGWASTGGWTAYREPNFVSIEVEHTKNSPFIIYTTKLLVAPSGHRNQGYIAMVDRSVPETISVDIIHDGNSDFRIMTIRLEVNMRTRQE
jgi:hypothetical protein